MTTRLTEPDALPKVAGSLKVTVRVRVEPMASGGLGTLPVKSIFANMTPPVAFVGAVVEVVVGRVEFAGSSVVGVQRITVPVGGVGVTCTMMFWIIAFWQTIPGGAGNDNPNETSKLNITEGWAQADRTPKKLLASGRL